MQKLRLDDWQKEVLETEGNICLRSGRQVGKSTVISIKAAEYAIKNRKKTIMVIASVERQAYLLLEKIISYLNEKYKFLVKKGKDRPTKHKVQLINGSVIYCLPTGLTGYGIRGYTVDLLIADEAAYIPAEVWTAVTPSLAVTKGNLILLSTPKGKDGYFYNCFNDDNFTSFHISAEDCPRKNVEFLEAEKKRMTKLQYAQEYLGEFVDEFRQFFSNELIKRTCILKRPLNISKRTHFLGIDVARMGGDETTYEILELKNKKLKQVENIIKTSQRLTETTKDIINLNKTYPLKKIFIDDGGLGVGVFDQLLEENATKRKVIAINNAQRSLSHKHSDDKKKKKLMKEDLYNNLLRLMEREEILLLDDEEIKMSLLSIQVDYTEDGNLKIWGRYSHICEGLIRAAWGMKEKGLKLWIA